MVLLTPDSIFQEEGVRKHSIALLFPVYCIYLLFYVPKGPVYRNDMPILFTRMLVLFPLGSCLISASWGMPPQKLLLSCVCMSMIEQLHRALPLPHKQMIPRSIL